MRLRASILILLLTIAVLALNVQSRQLRIPEYLNPWATLQVDAPPNFLTRYKLARLSNDIAACRSVLATTGIQFEPIDDEMTGPGCGFFNAVRVDRTSVEVGAPFVLSCRAAVSLALWERHVLHPQVRRHFGLPVARIEHFGSYSCRNVYGRPNATRSRHATAEAFDVAGLVLEDGERIRIVNDWSGEHAAFLRTLRDGACRFFDGVLGPNYNDAHRDHLHFDRGPHRMCR